MDVRPAEPDDSARIRAIAQDSFRSSYALSPQAIETIVGHAFTDEAVVERVNDPDAVVLVAEQTVDDATELQGFVDADVAADPERTIRWLHVDPEARGQGTATALIERVREGGDGTALAARVLEDAVEGHEFLERFGLESDGNDRTEFGGEEFAVALFTEGEGTDDSNRPSVPVPDSVTTDGADRPLDREESVPGREAPFFPIHVDADRAEQYGFFCSQCASTDVSADGLDRLECGNCGNVHLADEWDDAYL